ncbi:hypothetical protein IRT45_30750 [Nocardia sp. BSTN01]|uniref:hypothetical protein n=1 Tax=Nocardia sp. BSTN01 TaxID=2783665 RepID=UPI00188FAB85|nr:hypothetical protein [Nocardia sp. BSTN01]MBF5001514.1 hypothetical protein [Nocardia sp. BSTN01]
MIIDQLEVSYGEQWGSWRGTAHPTPMSSTVAARRHDLGDSYAVLLAAHERPLLRAEYWGKDWAARQPWRVFLFDDRSFEVRLLELEPHSEGWLRIGRETRWEYADADQYRSRQGEESTSAPADEFLVPAPAFGDWQVFARLLVAQGDEVADSVTLCDRPSPAEQWQSPPREHMPEDYRRLLAESGPGTLAGVLRLLAPDGPEGFDMRSEQQRHPQPDPDPLEWEEPKALLWGVFDSGETCWWLPIRDTPSQWLVIVAGKGFQQLNISTTEFLRRWVAGELDLPVLSLPPVARTWTVEPAGQPVTVPDLPSVGRDPLAQLATIIGPGVARTYDWSHIEQELGLPLPTDYKRLAESYGGPAGFPPFLGVELNGIFVADPNELASEHEGYEPTFEDDYMWYEVGSGRQGGRLACASTEGRQIVGWDTSGPDIDAWPVLDVYTGEVLARTLTELLVAELTGTGPGLTGFGSGDPAEMARPIWGPDKPW